MCNYKLILTLLKLVRIETERLPGVSVRRDRSLSLVRTAVSNISVLLC